MNDIEEVVLNTLHNLDLVKYEFSSLVDCCSPNRIVRGARNKQLFGHLTRQIPDDVYAKYRPLLLCHIWLEPNNLIFLILRIPIEDVHYYNLECIQDYGMICM